jgi:hypothetical protein
MMHKYTRTKNSYFHGRVYEKFRYSSGIWLQCIRCDLDIPARELGENNRILGLPVICVSVRR